MRTCKDHWQMCRDAIDERGMSGLVAVSSEEAHGNIVEELRAVSRPSIR